MQWAIVHTGPPLATHPRVPAAGNCAHSHLWQNSRQQWQSWSVLPTCPVYSANQNHMTDLNLLIP